MKYRFNFLSPLDVLELIPDKMKVTSDPKRCDDVCFVTTKRESNSKYTFIFSTVDCEDIPVLDNDKTDIKSKILKIFGEQNEQTN